MLLLVLSTSIYLFFHQLIFISASSLIAPIQSDNRAWVTSIICARVNHAIVALPALLALVPAAQWRPRRMLSTRWRQWATELTLWKRAKPIWRRSWQISRNNWRLWSAPHHLLQGLAREFRRRNPAHVDAWTPPRWKSCTGTYRLLSSAPGGIDGTTMPRSINWHHTRQPNRWQRFGCASTLPCSK